MILFKKYSNLKSPIFFIILSMHSAIANPPLENPLRSADDLQFKLQMDEMTAIHARFQQLQQSKSLKFRWVNPASWFENWNLNVLKETLDDQWVAYQRVADLAYENLRQRNKSAKTPEEFNKISSDWVTLRKNLIQGALQVLRVETTALISFDFLEWREEKRASVHYFRLIREPSKLIDYFYWAGHRGNPIQDAMYADGFISTFISVHFSRGSSIAAYTGALESGSEKKDSWDVDLWDLKSGGDLLNSKLTLLSLELGKDIHRGYAARFGLGNAAAIQTETLGEENQLFVTKFRPLIPNEGAYEVLEFLLKDPSAQRMFTRLESSGEAETAAVERWRFVEQFYSARPDVVKQMTAGWSLALTEQLIHLYPEKFDKISFQELWAVRTVKDLKLLNEKYRINFDSPQDWNNLGGDNWEPRKCILASKLTEDSNGADL